jgi:hypothetical protein
MPRFRSQTSILHAIMSDGMTLRRIALLLTDATTLPQDTRVLYNRI